MLMRDKLEVYQLTSVGDRESNQDCMAYIFRDDFALFVVADGLGGHHAGEKASQFFCRGFLSLADKYQAYLADNSPHTVFNSWVKAAIDEMAILFGDDPWANNAHTTCAILYLDKRQTVVAHCGDSRVYRMNEKTVLWRSKDHSMTQRLLEAGQISEREMGVHPEQNQLTRSINIVIRQKPEINVYPPIAKGETFLLCSDGFWEHIKDQELLFLAQPESSKPELKKMAKIALLRAEGHSDNITVQWIRGL